MLLATPRATRARVSFMPMASVASPSFESSILARASVQKSNDALSPATNLSFASVSLNSSTLGASTPAALLQKPIIRFDHVHDEMPECHLICSRLEVEFVGGHSLDGGDRIFLAAGDDLPQGAAHRVLRLR